MASEWHQCVNRLPVTSHVGTMRWKLQEHQTPFIHHVQYADIAHSERVLAQNMSIQTSLTASNEVEGKQAPMPTEADTCRTYVVPN